MNVLHFDKQNKIGPFKVMNAVNNGPCHKRHATNQWKSNLDTYKAARIPFARNHDAAFHAGYGGEHSVDITAIFPNFDADPYDPASYDFACTDEYILITLEAGTETYYRLGQKIEHYIKKFDTIPPKDFHKWAVMTAAQHSSIDMLMYYDARPTVFNGMFDFYTLRPLKGYYPFLWYGMLYDMEAEIACTGDLPENLYALAGVDAVGKALAVLTYYTDEEDQPATELSVNFGEQGQYEVDLLDEGHDVELGEETDVLTFTIRPNTCIMIREK